jgi:chromosomal replication initiation ATPase DnaA
MDQHIEIQLKFSSNPNSGSPSIIQLLIAHLCGVSIHDLLGKRGGARIVLARQIAMYLTHVVCGLNMAQVGASFRLDRSTASYACRRIEDLRDDPCFDRQLTQLENLLRTAGDIGVAL